MFSNALKTAFSSKVKLIPNCRLINSFISQEYVSNNNPSPLFFNKQVQECLKCLTRVDLNVVFKKRKQGDKKLDKPLYKFMTDDQLKEAIREAHSNAEEMLQMPPVVPIRSPINKVIFEDPALEGLDNSRHIITDITFGLKDNERLIVIREPNGLLKEADWEVRDRIIQLYFPKIGKNIIPPRLFYGKNFEDILMRKEYEYVLDRACVQFEPDDPEYQRITSIAYQAVNKCSDFKYLRSTRHFGPLAFFLTWFKNVDNLLLELIETAQIEEAVVLIDLYRFVHKKEGRRDSDGIETIRRFIAEETTKKGPLELALQTYVDLEAERLRLDKTIKAAHGYV